ncbi:hypothetical protein [Tsukamurella sp. NPDC003166]
MIRRWALDVGLMLIVLAARLAVIGALLVLRETLARTRGRL